MEMVAKGGHFLCVTPANNFMGHGFYQFSPELFFRVLCTENGFTVVSLILYEWHPGSTWFADQDPAKLGRRATLVNSTATHLAVLARRTAIVPVLSSPPYQSDYLQMWAESSTHHKPCPEYSTVLHMRGLRPLDVVRSMIRRLGFEVTRYPKHKDDWGDSSEFFERLDLPG